ncbi:acetoin utilization deacetylase AcuC-like enzyme [Pseudoduganella lurida]|uniref:Acetoin utilization deacetylase AcuC-like enzyme n=1 Tax=Pseudoduganella lurida TaxID=1036180 RepID=A0A562R1K4_9BURK|nr:histone deacetylase family protein [Pseudoduganella lurida]TWI62948.1 acetoin utilization deacetylase AcuC-like enzyme [Pseudoduganella lurida]
MLTFFNEQHGQWRPRHALVHGQPAPPRDTPDRIDGIVAELGRRGLGRIVTPHGVPLMSLERVHTPRYLHFVRTAWSEWLAQSADNGGRDAFPSLWPVRTARPDIEPDDFNARFGLYSADTLTPLTAGTWSAAKGGADCAINGAHALRIGERSTFALTRPAGHHAGAESCAGGCWLNNAALAAQHLLDDGLQRVAVLDVDYHHGSGTQAIFHDRSDVLTLSLHADPRGAYPFFSGHGDETGGGAGLGYNVNLPLPAGSTPQAWFAALETACVRLSMYRPDALVVALGANTFAGEVHGGFGLQGGDFLRLGERLAWLNLPTCFVFEGGSPLRELGVNVVNVLEGFETAL